MHNIRSPLLASFLACLLLVVAVGVTSCGGGGSSSGGGAVSTPVSTVSTPDMGTLTTVDDTFQLKITNASSAQLLTIAGKSQVAGAQLAQSTDTGTADVFWHVMSMGNSQYNIENLLTHQVAGLLNASTASGAVAVQWSDNGTNDHLWQFYKLTNGNYLIKNVNSALFLQVDTSASTTTIDQAARATTGTGCTCQEWTITPTTTVAYSTPLTVSGTGTGVHDPNMIQDGTGKFWLYGTHNTLASSTDMATFTTESAGIFSTDFSWWASKNTVATGGRTDLWAPSVLYANGVYYQYYSIPIYDTPSVAGSNKGAEAVIGLATSPKPNGPWTDAGQIIASCGTTTGCTTTFNAIDPAPFIDASGKWWLVFGSWEDGTHVLQLDPTTGLRLGTSMVTVAHRTGGEEGPFIYPKLVNGTQYYYYFASVNVCCKANAPYRIVMGRSTSPTGPFLDRGGLDLTNSGGTILLSSHSNFKGTGGQSVMTVGTKTLLVYHYYDANANGAPKLGLSYLGFDTDGWPYVQ